MKKLIAIAVVIIMAVSVFSAIAEAADVLEYVHIEASGNDPYANFTFHDGATIDPDTVKWAKIKYRTITETDNTGVQLIGQFYINPAAEPFVPVKYKHSQKWETLVIDLTSVSEKATVASKWNSSSYTGVSQIRFDPMESDRDAEAAHNEEDTAVVADGDCIDIAWIAFFESEADAKAYDGTQNTPAVILLPEDLAAYTPGNAIKSIELREEEVKAEDIGSGDDDPNPQTSDASVVAVATLACIALAGVVVAAKKTRK